MNFITDTWTSPCPWTFQRRNMSYCNSAQVFNVMGLEAAAAKGRVLLTTQTVGTSLKPGISGTSEAVRNGGVFLGIWRADASTSERIWRFVNKVCVCYILTNGRVWDLFFRTDTSDQSVFPNFISICFLSFIFWNTSHPSLFLSSILPVAFLFPLPWPAILASHSCPCQGKWCANTSCKGTRTCVNTLK